MNETKALKKQLLAAIAMVLVAALALGSSTFAWFVTNGSVTAQGMNVTAQSESGIVISNAVNGAYASTANAVSATAKQLQPTSTANAEDWYHSTSDKFDDANAGKVAEERLSEVEAAKRYLLNSFFIKSAAGSFEAADSLLIEEVTVTGATKDLSAALRIGVLVGSDENLYIFAPVTGSTKSYTVNGATAVTALTGSATAPAETEITTIPANDGTPIEAKIYVWYEGEDEACMSKNIDMNPDTLAVTVKFNAIAE